MILNPFATIRTKAKQSRQLLFGDRTFKQFNHPRQYFSPQSIAGYIGYLGHQNFGDDILFEAFKRLFPAWQFFPYDGAVDPVHNPPFNYYPLELTLYRRWIKPEFYNIVFLGGGTLINRRQYLLRLQHALKTGNECVVFGTGVADPVFWHEHDRSENFLSQIREWTAVLKDCASVYVRGARSAQILENHGLAQPVVISDPALSVCQPRSTNYIRNGMIGINIGSHGVLWGEERQVYETIVDLIHQLIASGWQVELLPLHRRDLNLSQQILQQINLPQLTLWSDYPDLERTIQRLKSYDMLIGQRLHAIVIACGCAVPFISLKYTPKCEDFLDSVGLQSFALRTDRLEVDGLLSLIQQIEQTYDDYCRQLIHVGSYYRNVQHQAAQSIVDRLLNGA